VALLDAVMPRFDVRERHVVTVHAPAALVMAVARTFALGRVPAVRAIFAWRQLMGARGGEPPLRAGLVEETRRLGWGCLVDQPGRAYAAGAACQPWLADVRFEPLPAEAFRAASPPDRVKIAWALEAEPLTPVTCRFATETRVVATDEAARRRFRAYWRWARVGIVAIRVLMLPAVRREAERRWRAEVGRQGAAPRH
jgi:hypothetical protein